jgi:hypothetical protein
MSEAEPPSHNTGQGSKAAEFILKLQEDLKFLAEFTNDPDKIMNEAGITSEEERNVLKTRDMLKIRQLLEKRNIHTSNSK